MLKVLAPARLELSIHGIGVRVESRDEAVLEALRRDFAYFTAAAAGAPVVSLELHPQAPPAALASRGRWWPGRGLRWRGVHGTRLVRYRDGELAVWSERTASGRIYCERPHRLHELAYLLILSKVGERLDAAGLHRVHALGFEHRGRGGLVLLPSGGGKTSLALALRGSPVRFLSEDTPLLAGVRLAAFPLRWGLRSREDADGIPGRLVRPFERRDHGQKWLVDAEHFADQLAAGASARWVFVGTRRAGAPAGIASVGPLRALGPLALNLVVGWGIPQMAEYMLSPRALPRLAAIALKRAATGAQLLRQASCHHFELGPSPQDAARALLAFLAAQD